MHKTRIAILFGTFLKYSKYLCLFIFTYFKRLKLKKKTKKQAAASNIVQRFLLKKLIELSWLPRGSYPDVKQNKPCVVFCSYIYSPKIFGLQLKNAK